MAYQGGSVEVQSAVVKGIGQMEDQDGEDWVAGRANNESDGSRPWSPVKA